MAYPSKNSREVNTAELTVVTARKVNEMLSKNRDAIMRSLPKGFNYDRMCRTLINAISTTPLLAKCTPSSIFLSAIRAFSLGLEPNGALGEGYLIPFWDSKKGGYETQFMPGYRGIQTLARRSGEITEIYARSVCEKDKFEVQEGTSRQIVHEPDYTKDRGNPVCYYAVYRLRDGSFDFEVMSLEEIEKVRKSSKASERGPWVDWPEEMAKKTVIKRLLKRAPMSIEMAGAIENDNRAATGDYAADIIDVEGIEIDEETPAEVQEEINRERAAEVKRKLEDHRPPEVMSNTASAVTDPVLASYQGGAKAPAGDELPMN